MDRRRTKGTNTCRGKPLPPALGLGAVLVALLASSCAAKMALTIRPDASALVEFSAEIPGPVADKLRKIRGAGRYVDPATPLFDLASMRSGIAERSELRLVDLSRPNPDSVKGAVVVDSLSNLAAFPAIAESGALTYAEGPGWTEIKIRLARGAGNGLAALLPGIDPGLLEALSPPALAEEDEAMSAADYRLMLRSIFGAKGLLALEGSAILVALSAPNAVIASGGGALVDGTLEARIPIIDALVLEKPVELWLRWRD
jgi:hypothetical protein